MCPSGRFACPVNLKKMEDGPGRHAPVFMRLRAVARMGIDAARPRGQCAMPPGRKGLRPLRASPEVRIMLISDKEVNTARSEEGRLRDEIPVSGRQPSRLL